MPEDNISTTPRIPSNINIAFAKYDAFSLMNKLPNFMISTGSACSAGEFDYSHVLKALDLSFDDLKNSGLLDKNKIIFNDEPVNDE